MSKSLPKEVLTNNGNPALNNIELYQLIRDSNLKRPPLKSICYTLATYRNNATGQCNPDMRSIANGAGCTKNTVIRCLKELANLRALIILNDDPTDGITRNRYYFTLDMPRLKEMFNHDDHEIEKSCEYEYVEEAIYIYDSMF